MSFTGTTKDPIDPDKETSQRPDQDALAPFWTLFKSPVLVTCSGSVDTEDLLCYDKVSQEAHSKKNKKIRKIKLVRFTAT